MSTPQRQQAAVRFFYGVQGTPFIDAAEAWWWTLDCLEARGAAPIEGSLSPGCGSLTDGRPCEPDDVVLAMARLKLPPAHARTVAAYGKRREAPPPDTQARRHWDEVMQHLDRVLQAKGIVAPPSKSTARRPRDSDSARGA